jgi:peptidyl-prolyl cis-trans isomerase C/peptidyl-prolyl cis-trans isomerase SurA
MTRRLSILTFAVAVLALTGACADLTEPGPSGGQAPGSQAVVAPAAAAPAAEAPGSPDRINAAHVLIAYQGSARSSATRSKDEAKTLAAAVLARAKAGEDFAELARKHSDDPSAKSRGGDLGSFSRDMMVKPFSDAAFGLKPGGISDVVETDFGFHVIRRSE